MSGRSPCIEVCIDSVESAIAAVSGGCTRLEICGNLGIGGGTTPSLGLLRRIKQAVPTVQTMVMIRPRVGDFLFTNYEMETMLEDIKIFKEENVTGVVLGILQPNGTIDKERTRILVAAAKPLEAFDMTRDPFEALQDIAQIGRINRILTSGHGRSAPGSLETLGSLAERANNLQPPITILPGSGINPQTISAIVNCGWWKVIKEVHLSAGFWKPGQMEYKKEDMGMGIGGEKDWSIWRSDANVVRAVKMIAEANRNES